MGGPKVWVGALERFRVMNAVSLFVDGWVGLRSWGYMECWRNLKHPVILMSFIIFNFREDSVVQSVEGYGWHLTKYLRLECRRFWDSCEFAILESPYLIRTPLVSSITIQLARFAKDIKNHNSCNVGSHRANWAVRARIRFKAFNGVLLIFNNEGRAVDVWAKITIRSNMDRLKV